MYTKNVKRCCFYIFPEYMNATPLERIRLREKCVEMYFVLFKEYTAMCGVL